MPTLALTPTPWVEAELPAAYNLCEAAERGSKTGTLTEPQVLVLSYRTYGDKVWDWWKKIPLSLDSWRLALHLS